MNRPQTAPYGAWTSPISADLIVAETIGLGDIVLSGDDTYWVESRPTEAGRAVIVKHSANGDIVNVTPAPFSARSAVHEYGGGAFTVQGDTVYFVNFKDQGIYKQTSGEQPEALIVVDGLRFADLVVDQTRQRLLCICEDHRNHAQNHEPVNCLAAIDLAGCKEPTILASGADFYASPALSPDGKQLAWLCWHHPNMPWDGTELYLAEFDDQGELSNPHPIAGSDSESVFQPQWSPDGVLHFVSDRSGWWNLYCWQNQTAQALKPMAAEFGLPQWVFCMSTYGFAADGQLLCSYGQEGIWQLAQLNSDEGTFTPIELPYSNISGIRATGQRLVFHGGSASHHDAIVELDLTAQQGKELRRASELDLAEDYLSQPEAISFPTSQGRTAHAFYYPPCNTDYQASSTNKPPLLVKGHGGPTSATSTSLNLSIQYWTSRGFAVVDVNYGGSTGYGREYRRQLDGQWGVVDVDDCIAAAQYLIDSGRVDGGRCAIRGNSAGGYTTLAALAFHSLFNAGASYYGISDLEILATDTHKFESRYLDRLIGSYPEEKQRYQQRSPINAIDQLSAPVIFFQGLEDKVVPPNQAELMVNALRDKGIPVAYVTFADERHGFRQAENIKRTLEAELYFYSHIFGFPLAEAIEPVTIENLEAI